MQNNIIENNQLSLEAERMIIEYKEELNKFKELEKKFNESLKNEMEKRGIISYKDENLSISYIGETERETFDSKLLKEKYPYIYDEFVKKTNVKASVRVTIKKGVASDNLNEIKKVDMVQINEIESF